MTTRFTGFSLPVWIPSIQFRQRVHQLTANGAAKASFRQLYDALARAFDQHVIDADIAEFIDDDRRVAHVRVLEEPIEQRSIFRRREIR